MEAFQKSAIWILSWLIPELSREACTERLFGQVLTLNHQRIHGRLQSKYWKRPSHRVFRSGVLEKLRPLHEELRKLSRRFKDQLSTHRAGSMKLFRDLDNLCSSYQDIDTCQTEAETVNMLKAAIKQSHALYTSRGSTTLSPMIIRSWESPMERAISATSPFRVSVGKLFVEIGFDGPSQGLVTVTNIAKSTTEAVQNLIDVKSMDPNELLDVFKVDGDNSLTVNLNYGRPHSMQIKFQWP